MARGFSDGTVFGMSGGVTGVTLFEFECAGSTGTSFGRLAGPRVNRTTRTTATTTAMAPAAIASVREFVFDNAPVAAGAWMMTGIAGANAGAAIAAATGAPLAFGKTGILAMSSSR